MQKAKPQKQIEKHEKDKQKKTEGWLETLISTSGSTCH
jgi:hypothetical protein